MARLGVAWRGGARRGLAAGASAPVCHTGQGILFPGSPRACKSDGAAANARCQPLCPDPSLPSPLLWL